MRAILFNSCWILGLAVILAAFSYHYHLAVQHQHPLRKQLGDSTFASVAWIGLTLIGVGGAGTSRHLWEAALWIIISLGAVWHAAAFFLVDGRSEDKKQNGT